MKKFLIVLQSDKLYGTYYEYNTTTGKFKLLTIHAAIQRSRYGSNETDYI